MKTETAEILRIQRAYFSLLKDYFWHLAKEVEKSGSDSEDYLGSWLKNQDIKVVVYKVKRCLDDITHFWSRNYQQLRANFVSLDLLSVYSVSRPMYLSKQIVSAGMYVDTIMCHDDSIIGLRNFDIESINKDSLAVNLLHDLIDLILLEPCFVSDVDPPLAIICPGERDFHIEIEKEIIGQSLQLITQFASELLDSNYSDWEEVQAHTRNIIGAQAIKRAIKRIEILPALFRVPKNDADKLSQCFQRMRILERQALSGTFKYPSLKNLLISFMAPLGVIEGQLHGSVELDLSPLFPRYAWDLYKWRAMRGSIESAKVLGWEERHTSAVTTAFQHESLDWLTNIPLKGLIELRKEGFMEEFRRKIRLARKRMTIQESVDFENVAKSVNDEINEAIAEHISKTNALEEEVRKRLKMEGINIIEKISLGIAGFLCWPISILNSVKEVTTSALELVKTSRQLENIPAKLRRGPWGLLIQTKYSKKG